MLAKSLEIAETTPIHHQDDPAWDRDPDGTIIKMFAPVLVFRADVLCVVDDWLAKYKGHFQISGSDDQEQKVFVAKFTGPPGTAKVRLQTALGELRNLDGSWKSFQVKVASGSAGSDSSSLSFRPLSISEDKTAKQVAREVSGKRLRDLLTAMHPGTRFYLNRADGKISSAYIPIVRAVPKPDREVHVEWNMSSPVIKLINREELVAKFRASNAGAAVKETWQI